MTPNAPRTPRAKVTAAAVALAAAVAGGVIVLGDFGVSTAGASASRAPVVAFTPVMPAPTGKKQIGKVDLHLVDKTRGEPWPKAGPGPRAKRELMVSVYYPARDAGRYKVAPYTTPRVAGLLGEYSTRVEFGLNPRAVNWAGIKTHAHQGAPVERGKHPVLLYSTEHLRTRGYATAQAEELASHGYIVVTTESTHEAFGVEFPTPNGSGRVERIRLGPGGHPSDPRKMTEVRVADQRFVLDRLADLNAGRNPDHEQRPLPEGLRGGLDPRGIGIYGHVGGSVAGLETMRVDRRVKAVAGLTDLIGTSEQNFAPVVRKGVARPYLLFSTTEKNCQAADCKGQGEIGNHAADKGWAAFWPKLKGWKLNVQLQDSHWHALGDYIWLVPQIRGITNKTRNMLIGTVSPDRAVKAQNAYLNAFFDLHLRHRDNRILHHASPAHPDVTFLP